MNTTLPDNLRAMLATPEIRMFHSLWHYVRNEDDWNSFLDADKNELIQLGWEPPRFEDQAGSGLDFLFMHRQMIQMVNEFLIQNHSPNYTHIEGWDLVPFDHNDATWPMPPIWTDADDVFVWAKHPNTTSLFQTRSMDNFRDSAWLQQRTLDEVGIDLELSIHGWMHLHWTKEPTTDPFDTSPANDWLADPFSSHVNDAFWKLHGWIDDRIGNWESATGEQADFSQAWSGAPGVLPRMHHTADERAFRLVRANERPQRIMTWKVPIIEGVIEREVIVRKLPSN